MSPNVVLTGAGPETLWISVPYHRVRLKTLLDIQPIRDTTYFSTRITNNSMSDINRPTQIPFSKYSSRARYSSTSGPEIKPFVIRTSTPAQGFRWASQWRLFHSYGWFPLAHPAAFWALMPRRIQQTNPYKPGSAAATIRMFSVGASISDI